MFLLGAGFGKDVGVGAAIGYATVDSSVLANLSAIVVAPTVNVGATVMDPTTGSHRGRTVNIQSIAGGGALYFGGDACWRREPSSNAVTAEVGGSRFRDRSGNAPMVNVDIRYDNSTPKRADARAPRSASLRRRCIGRRPLENASSTSPLITSKHHNQRTNQGERAFATAGCCRLRSIANIRRHRRPAPRISCDRDRRVRRSRRKIGVAASVTTSERYAT